MRKTFVILHGWGLSGSRFAPLVAALKKKGARVFAPDFPGFDGTSPEHPLTLSDYAMFLRNYLERNNLRRPILIGHSFGGRVALKFESMYSGTAKALVLTGTPGFSPVPRVRLLLFILLAKIGKAFWSLPPFSFLLEPVRKFYYWLVGAREYYRAQGSMRQTFKNIVKEDLGGLMRTVSVPTLLLWGEDDRVVPVTIARRMQGAIPNVRLTVVKNADHGFPYKQPERFIESLT